MQQQFNPNNEVIFLSAELSLNSVHQLFFRSIVQDDWRERGAVAVAKSPGGGEGVENMNDTHHMHKIQNMSTQSIIK